MSDISYDPFGRNTEDLIEETVTGSFGRVTLYCKYGCCGDNKNAECCLEEQTVDPSGMETYKLVSIIAAGLAGLCMITVALLYVIKKHMKQRRLIRDINSINKMNNLKDISKVKASKYDNKKSGGQTNFAKKNEKLFKKSKKSPKTFVPPTPMTSTVPSLGHIPTAHRQPLADVKVNVNHHVANNSVGPTPMTTTTGLTDNLQPVRPPVVRNSMAPVPSVPNSNNNTHHVPSVPAGTHVPAHAASTSLVADDKALPPPPILATPVPPPPIYRDALFGNNIKNTAYSSGNDSVTTSTNGPRLAPLFGAGNLFP